VTSAAYSMQRYVAGTQADHTPRLTRRARPCERDRAGTSPAAEGECVSLKQSTAPSRPAQQAARPRARCGHARAREGRQQGRAGRGHIRQRRALHRHQVALRPPLVHALVHCAGARVVSKRRAAPQQRTPALQECGSAPLPGCRAATAASQKCHDNERHPLRILRHRQRPWARTVMVVDVIRAGPVRSSPAIHHLCQVCVPQAVVSKRCRVPTVHKARQQRWPGRKLAHISACHPKARRTARGCRPQRLPARAWHATAQCKHPMRTLEHCAVASHARPATHRLAVWLPVIGGASLCGTRPRRSSHA